MEIEEYAARAMQSLLLMPETRNWTSEKIAEEAFKIARAMDAAAWRDINEGGPLAGEEEEIPVIVTLASKGSA